MVRPCALDGSEAYSCSFNDRDEHLFLIKAVRRAHIYFLWSIKVTDVISGGGVSTQNGNDPAEQSMGGHETEHAFQTQKIKLKL